MGQRYLFTLYDPSTSEEVQGVISGPRELQRILGRHGKDLFSPIREQEMLLFILRHRVSLLKEVRKEVLKGESEEVHEEVHNEVSMSAHYPIRSPGTNENFQFL